MARRGRCNSSFPLCHWHGPSGATRTSGRAFACNSSAALVRAQGVSCHTQTTRTIIAVRNSLIRRAQRSDSRAFDSHHPLHFPARLRRRHPTPARVSLARYVLIARSYQIFIVFRVDCCRPALVPDSHVGDGCRRLFAGGPRVSKRAFVTEYYRPAAAGMRSDAGSYFCRVVTSCFAPTAIGLLWSDQ